MKKLHKMMKAFAVCVALALVFCMIPVGSVYAETNAENESGNGSENGGNGGTPGKEDPEKTVQVTIDNTKSHLAVRFYKDTNNIDEDVFEGFDPGQTSDPIEVKEGATARIRLYVQKDGHCIPDGYSIDGATRLKNDSQVNNGWCRAAFVITIKGDEKGEMKISIPEASVCTHPDADPNVRWGYHPCEEGRKHIQACTVCGIDNPKTLSEHTFKEMTPAEYADWYYNDSNFANNSADWIAAQKANLSRIWCEDLGITADTKAKFCTLCEYAEKLPTQDTTSTDNKTDSSSSSSTSGSQPAEAPAPAPTPAPAAEVPAAQPVAAGLADASGVLPEGATIAAATVTSGATYEKAVEVIKAQVSGLGEFSVMEINLTDAANTQVHQLNGYVQVTVPMPANITVKEGKAIVVYRLEDDGTLTRCDTTVENGVITFKTNHFSTYIVAEEDVTAVTSPKTEDASAGINLIFCMGILLAGAAAVAVKRKMA